MAGKEDLKAEAKTPLDPKVEAAVDAQMARLTRGVTQLISEEDLRRKIARSIVESRPLRVKLGVDPTAHDLHLGFTLHLARLQTFLELGHQPVLIIGDTTAMVGDPTGRNKARPQLDQTMVEDYARSYLEQAASVLDVDKVEVRRNSEWLLDLGFHGLVGLLAKSTVAQMLVRDDFSKRYADGTAIYLHELVYPMLQGWDSVAIGADVELGGQDQLFNLLVGRELQQGEGMDSQVCMMSPILVGLDGDRKMSKSFDNYIGVSETASSMFGKIMSLPDDTMRAWFELLTTRDLAEVDDMLVNRHPRDSKDTLARDIVTRFHDETAAAAASDEFRRVFAGGELPDDIPEIDIDLSVAGDDGLWIVALVVQAGFAPTNGEARRLVAQGGVRIDGEVVPDVKANVVLKGGEVLRVGKKKFGRVVVS